MFDRALLPLQHRVLARPAAWLRGRGVSADAVTVVGFVVGLGAVPFLSDGRFGVALACILLNRLADGLDGAIARLGAPTDRGAFLDIALDFFFYASVPFGFALADPAANALPAAGLILAFVGTGSSFLAYATIAAQRGMPMAYPRKGLHYIGGLTEGVETIAAFAIFCFWPPAFPTSAAIFAGLCLLTTGVRWWWGWSTFTA